MATGKAAVDQNKRRKLDAEFHWKIVATSKRQNRHQHDQTHLRIGLFLILRKMRSFPHPALIGWQEIAASTNNTQPRRHPVLWLSQGPARPPIQRQAPPLSERSIAGQRTGPIQPAFSPSSFCRQHPPLRPWLKPRGPPHTHSTRATILPIRTVSAATHGGWRSLNLFP